MTDTTTDYARGFRAGIEAAARLHDRLSEWAYEAEEDPKCGQMHRDFAERIRALAPAAPDPVTPRINIRCNTNDHGLLGTTYLDVVRVEQEDDGSWTAVTDHWPARTIAAPEPSENEKAYLRDQTCILRKGKNGDTVICGQSVVEGHLRQGYQFDWKATDEARARDRAALAAMQAVPEPSEVEPDMFWSKREDLYPEETPLEDWRDELDGADPFTPVEIEVGKRMGSRWVVYIPTDDSDHWHDDCHMFATEADARAALAAMGRV